MCSALSLKSLAAPNMWIHFKRCMRVQSLLDWAEITWTTTMSSHSANTCWWCHSGPQMAHTTAVGTNSLAEMLSDAQSLPQGCWSHACCHTAPHPHEPEASDANVTVGFHCGWWVSIMLLAFHDGSIATHHDWSAWNSTLSLIQYTRFFGFCRQVDHPPQKNPSLLYYLASVGQLPNQQQQFALPAHTFVPPGTDQWSSCD